MKFESVSNSYEVINLCQSSPEFDIYTCVCGKQYLLLCIKSDALKLSCCEVFLPLLEAGEFDGIQQLFTDRDNLIAVFTSNTLCDTFQSAAQQETSFSERLEFLHTVLSGLCIHGVPVPIACDLLLHDNIGCMADGNPGCRYVLHEIASYNQLDMAEFSRVLAGKVRQLFELELQDGELKQFCRMLEREPPNQILTVFEQYHELYLQYQAKFAEGGLSQNSSKEKLIKLVKGLITALKLLLTAAALAAAVWLLLKAALPDEKQGGTMEQIGEIPIEEYEAQP